MREYPCHFISFTVYIIYQFLKPQYFAQFVLYTVLERWFLLSCHEILHLIRISAYGSLYIYPSSIRILVLYFLCKWQGIWVFPHSFSENNLTFNRIFCFNNNTQNHDKCFSISLWFIWRRNKRKLKFISNLVFEEGVIKFWIARRYHVAMVTMHFEHCVYLSISQW